MKDILDPFDVWIGGVQHGSSSTIVTLTGLVDGYAEIGEQIGFTSNLTEVPDGGVKWSDVADHFAPAAYGIGNEPTDFSSGDGDLLFVHVSHAGATYTASAPIRQAVAPSVITVPTISGDAVTGQTLAATPASFAGDGIATDLEWETSFDGLQGWSGTGQGGLTSPALQLGLYYRVRMSATNTKGTVEAVSNVIGEVTEEAAVVIQSLSVAAPPVNGELAITLQAAGAKNDDTVHWVLSLASEPDPSAADVRAGQAAGGAMPVDSGTGSWPGPFSASLSNNILLADYCLFVVIDNGLLSEVAASSVFALETGETLVMPENFGTSLFRNSSHYFAEHQTGDHALANYTGNTVFVANSGSDASGTGDEATPFATLDHAISQANPLDRISMAPGTYATPSASITKSLAFERTGSEGDVLIGRFDDLSGAQVDPTNVATTDGADTNTLWNVDDIGGETFCGFLRLDGARPGGVRGAAQARTNSLCSDYQRLGVPAVFPGGTSANFTSGTVDTIPALIAVGHIRAWVQEETQSFQFAADAYVGPDIVIANNASRAVHITAGTVVLDRCEIYGGSEDGCYVEDFARCQMFGVTVGGAKEDNIHYGNSAIGLEVNVTSSWPGSLENDNASTAHNSSKVLRVGGQYRGGARTIHDVQSSEIFNLSIDIRDALFFDQTLVQIGNSDTGNPSLVYGDLSYEDAFLNQLVIYSGAASQNVELTDIWPYT